MIGNASTSEGGNPSLFGVRNAKRLQRYANGFQGRIELFVFSLMVAGNILHVSVIFDVFFDKSYLVGIAIQYATFLIYAFVAFARGHFKTLVAFGLLGIYFMAQCILFSFVSGIGYNFNAALTNAVLIVGLAFYETRLPLGLVLKVLLIEASVYILIYLGLNNVILHQNGASKALLTDCSWNSRVSSAVYISVRLVLRSFYVTQQTVERIIFYNHRDGSDDIKYESRVFSCFCVIGRDICSWIFGESCSPSTCWSYLYHFCFYDRNIDIRLFRSRIQSLSCYGGRCVRDCTISRI